MLELVYVVSGYGRMTILKGICIKVEKGEIVTLIGANGAGKSTTLNTICGIIPARSGKIYFEESDITNLPTKEIVFRGITQIPEGRRLFPEMSVKENIEMGAYLRNDKEEINTDINKIYDIFPVLKEREKLQAGSLSGGEQQMLAIARGLMAKPKLLLMDEPSLGLAPIIVEQIFKIIKEINKAGTTIFIVEQNAYKALSIAHRGYVIATGEIVLSDTGQNLLKNELVRKTYLGESDN